MKYSIIIPTLNSLNYLKDAINSVIKQNFNDYELIISDNHSDDETYEYVKSLNHKNIILIQPQTRLPMPEHWDFAISSAKGEWLTALGSDDGLMPYFFQLAEYYTQIAKEKNIHAIGSERSYYFWEGCQYKYGDNSYSYNSRNYYVIKNSIANLLQVCFNKKESYNRLPHMYTSSLIHSSVIDTIRKEQNGALFNSITIDSYLTCNIMLEEKHHIHSYIPLGIVGSSSASNGLKQSEGKLKKSNNDFYTATAIQWNETMGKVGDFIHNHRFYLLEALLNSYRFQKRKNLYSFIHSKLFKKLMLARLYSEVNIESNAKKEHDLAIFENLLRINKIKQKEINFICKYFQPLSTFYYKKFTKYERKRSEPLPANITLHTGSIHSTHSETDCPRLMDFWHKVQKLEISDSSFVSHPTGIKKLFIKWKNSYNKRFK